MATEKQLRFVSQLTNERVVDEWTAELVKAAETMTTAEASRLVAALLASPRRKAESVAPAREIQPGMYTDGIRIFKAYVGQSGRILAKELDVYSRSFEYRGLASRVLAGMRRMTLEEAEEFGAVNAFCMCCGRLLTAEESVTRRIGPICIKYFN